MARIGCTGLVRGAARSLGYDVDALVLAACRFATLDDHDDGDQQGSSVAKDSSSSMIQTPKIDSCGFRTFR
ncbi:hypothetical protein PHSY_003626 [Pseudozyma hubeiensis SY62]|uniref:Uncharacterized protein n=1 Tax=Pseudozyma hubeiensis (strain SY62) TaxID=1305764 RepID=R9P465_PSEHS|nr:hypothetical protein PHSY_003626 [Pseudozyma hubeiensis SY62]GAC96047.1 hypothetical protein PHSY_003626 [Pseudozyma hubeiensis SY62]